MKKGKKRVLSSKTEYALFEAVVDFIAHPNTDAKRDLWYSVQNELNA